MTAQMAVVSQHRTTSEWAASWQHTEKGCVEKAALFCKPEWQVFPFSLPCRAADKLHQTSACIFSEMPGTYF